MASSVNAEKFVVTYKVEGDGAAFYTIEKGVLKLKNYTDASNGKIAQPKATVTITGTDFKKVTAFADVTAKAASTDPEVSPTISAVKFDGTKEQVADVTVPYGTTGGSIVLILVLVRKFMKNCQQRILPLKLQKEYI